MTDAEAVAEASGDGVPEAVVVAVSEVASTGTADVRPTSRLASPSVEAPPASAGLGGEPGASRPSSARLSPPAARTKPVVRNRTRRRRRRCAAALRSRRLARPAAGGPPDASASSTRGTGTSSTLGVGTSPTAADSGSGVWSSPTGVPHPGQARAPLRCRRHGWQ
ncbi:hypothetical protein K3A88_06835 [Streptomyces geysiriensis]|uniref:hypothetical protein n=1 Tax=Streptomyces geysiriensis TaxID=68207 RepID=UPI001C7DD27C|nr:hypothetical protein [Streptomyces geysiriensis]MBX4174751.1 hypothetical protein [Streptomyces geysiriensis]